jgi:hypothetical protein
LTALALRFFSTEVEVTVKASLSRSRLEIGADPARFLRFLASFGM